MKSGGIGCVIAVILLFSSFPIIPEMSAHGNPSKTINVDDDNTEGPWDGTQEHPFQYIQDAIDEASNGDSVFVYSGIYYEQLKVDKSITLQGEDKNTTVIDGEKIDDVIHLTGNDTTIRGFTIRYSDDGLNSDDAGIDIRGNNNLITGNIIKNNYNFGMYIQALDSNNTIKQNIFEDNSLAMELRFTSYTVVSNNKFINSPLSISFDYVVHAEILHNEFIDSNNAFTLTNSYSCNLSGNTITNGGINLYTSCSNIFMNNHIEGEKKFDDGIFLTYSSDGNLFKNNEIINHKDGIRLFAGSDGNIITGNIIRNNSRYGIYFESAGCNDNTISGNTIVNNSQYGIYFGSEGYGNSIYYNNFLNNQNHANNKGENSWDDGWKGNYWDDYETRYPDAHKTLRGVWNTPYELNDNNADRYPLMKPYSHAKATLMNRLWELLPDGHILKNLVFGTYLHRGDVV